MVLSFLVRTSLWIPLIYYLIYRWKNRCNDNIFSLLFILTEIMVLLIGCINCNILVEGTIKNKCKDNKIIADDLEHFPSVLIIVPTYNEDVDILKKTLLEIRHIDYPNLTVVIGDDGKNPITKNLIEFEFPNFHYHTRTNIQGHAKAGNINDILFDTINDNNYKYQGEFVLILDCDMIPKYDIIKNLLPLFYEKNKFNEIYFNSNCAFIQSPQKFYNIKGIDFLGQHYKFFYNVVLPAYNGFELGVPCCGTNVLFSRKHLDLIHGFQYGSVTEDFNTSLLLHSKGFISKYYPHETAYGLSPEKFMDFYHQRKRWTIGGMQIVFQKSFFNKFIHLPYIYKWIYVFSGLTPVFSCILAFILIGPMVNLLTTKNFICNTTADIYIQHIVPYVSVYLIYLVILHRQLSIGLFLFSIQESIFIIPLYIRYLIIFIIKQLKVSKITFKCTPKNIIENRTISPFFILLPYIIYYIIVFYVLVVNNVDFYKIDMISLFWMLCACFQMINPFLFCIQNYILKFM